MYSSPGIGDDRLKWILAEINKSQQVLDDRIAIARFLPDTEPSKTARIIRLSAMKREVNTSFTNLDTSMRRWADNDIPSMYKSGWLVGTVDVGASFDFTLPHREALDIISYDAYTDVATRLKQVSSQFAATADKQSLYEGMDPGQILAIQDKSRSAVAVSLLTGEADPRKVAKGLADDLWEDGVTIVDGGGNHWGMETYTRMLVRTKSANAYNAGSLNKYAESGVTRVTVYDGVLDDDVCADANGQVWTLKYAMEHTIAHPNCRRAFSAKPGTGYANEGLGEEAAERAKAGVKTAQKTITGFALMSQLLREFRHPEQFAPSRTLSQFAVRGAEAIIGVPLFFVDDFISGLVAAPLRQFDEAVEGVINPAMYAAGLVSKMPSVGDIYKIKDPQRLIDVLAGAVDNAAVVAIPGGQQQVSATSSAIRSSAMGNMIASGLVTVDRKFIAHIRRTHLLKLVDLAGVPQLAVNRYGQITSEIFHQWSRGNSEPIKLLFKQSAETVDNLRFVRAAANDLYRSTGQEAILIRRDIDTKIRVIQQYLNEGFFAVDDQRSLVRLLDAEGLGGVAEFKLTPQRREELEAMLDKMLKLREYADQKVTELAQLNARNFGGVADPIELTALRLTDEMKADGVKSLADFRSSKIKGSLVDVPSAAPTQLSIVEEVSVQRHIDDVKKRANDLRGPRRAGESLDDWRARAAVVNALDEVARLMENTQEFVGTSNPTAQKILTKLREPVVMVVPPPSAPKTAVTGKKLNAPARGTPASAVVPAEATPADIERFSASLETILETAETDVIDEAAWDEMTEVLQRLSAIVEANTSDPRAVEILSYITSGKVQFSGSLMIIGAPQGTIADIGKPEVLRLLAGLMRELSFKGGKVIFTGKEVGPSDVFVSSLWELMLKLDPKLFSESRVWLDEITAGADTMLMLRHLGAGYQTDPGNAAAVLFRFFRDSVNEIRSQGQRALPSIIGGESAGISNYGRILRQIYGVNNVQELGTHGVNGSVWKVIDKDGTVFVVKPVRSSRSGDVEAGILSYALSEWVDGYLMDGATTVPVTVIKLNGEDEYLGIMRFVDGGMWDDVDWEHGSEIPDGQLRDMRLLDMLSGEHDGHQQNFMFDQRTGVSYSIDNEMSAGALMTINGRLMSQNDAGGIVGNHVPTIATRERAGTAWLNGLDEPGVANGVPVKLVELTDDDADVVLALFGVNNPGAGARMVSNIADTSDYPVGMPFRVMIVTDSTRPSGYRVYVPTGRTGVVASQGMQGAPSVVHTFTIPLSGTESKKIRALAELVDPSKRVGSDIADEINATVKGAIDSMSQTTRDRVLSLHAANMRRGRVGSVDDLVDDIADQTVDVLSRRAQMLLEDATVVDRPIRKAIGKNGVDVEVGGLVDAMLPDGTHIDGLVTNIFVDHNGVTRIHFLPGIGMGYDSADLIQMPVAVTIASVDDLYRNARAVRVIAGLTPEEELFVSIGKSIKVNAKTPSVLDAVPSGTARVVEIPRVDAYGVRIGYDEQHIPIFSTGRADKGIRVVGKDGKEGFVSWSKIEDSGVLQEILDDELAKIPPAYRPREIVLHFDEIKTTDGKSAFGYIEADTRRMHVSYAAALTDARMRTTADGVVGYNIRARVAGDDVAAVIRSVGEANKQLDGFRELVRHELGHVVKVSIEEQTRARIAVSVWENLVDMYGTLPDNRAALNALIASDELIPPALDVSMYDDLVDAFIAYRTELIEDILNTNLVHAVDDVFEEALANGDLPTWMARAYGDIMRKEPDAHHEFFAELLVRILEEGGDDSAVTLVARRLNVSKSSLEAMLDIDNVPDLPRMIGWDLEDPIFHKWLASVLDSRARTVIPRDRSINKKLWKLKSPIGIDLDDLVDDIIKQLNEGDGGGATIHIHTGAIPEGDVVTVARKANEKVVQGVTEKTLKRTLEAFLNKAENRQFLDQEQWSLGIWLQADGEIYIDVSMVFDDPIDAAIFGFKEGQLAGFRFSDFSDEHYLDRYKDFDAWFEARGKVILKERGIELTDDLYNAITQRVGAAFADLVPHRRREVRGSGGKHLPVGMDVYFPWQQKKLYEAAETKYVVGVKEGKEIIATAESVVITPLSVETNLKDVLRRAMKEYKFVDRSLPNDEWLKARNIRVKAVGVSQSELNEFIDELRDAYDLMDRLGIKAPGMLDQPGRFHDNVIVFSLESGKKMQKYGATAKAPNGASSLGFTHINRTWRNLPGSLSRSRQETLIHEIGHQVDPKGHFGKLLRLKGFSPSDLGDAATYARISDDEFFAEAFLAVLTGRASPELHEAIVGFEFLAKELFVPIGLVELDRGAALRILHRFYEDWNGKYKALSAETQIPMWKLVGVAAILSPGMTAEINRDAASFMIQTWASNPRIAGSQVTRFRKFLYETAEGIREAALKDKDYIPKKTQETLDHLELLAKRLTGKNVRDYGDELAAYAISFLAQESGIMVAETVTLSLTGKYGMPQVIRAMKVTSGTYTLDDGLGNTKTRSFYNNIMDPKNLYRAGDVTIDFHMANAAAMILGMQDIKHALPSALGMEAGLRPIIGDIVRKLYDEGWGDLVHSDSPAELQEVIWAIWRASTDWEKDKLWFGEMRLVTQRADWKSALSDAEWRRLTQ